MIPSKGNFFLGGEGGLWYLSLEDSHSSNVIPFMCCDLTIYESKSHESSKKLNKPVNMLNETNKTADTPDANRSKQSTIINYNTIVVPTRKLLYSSNLQT